MKRRYVFHILPEFASSALSTVESSIRDHFSWMVSHKLSKNPNKIEYLLFNSKT